MFKECEFHAEQISNSAKFFIKLIFLKKEKDLIQKINYEILIKDKVSNYYKGQFYTKKIVEEIFISKDFNLINFPKKYRNYSKYWENILKSKCAYSAIDFIKFVNFVETQIENKKNQNFTVNIYYPASHLLDFVCSKYKKITKSKIKFHITSNLKYHLLYFFPGIILYLFFKSLKSSRNSKKAISPKIIKKGTILVQYAGHIMMKRYPDYSHLFWHKDSRVSANRIIIYSDRKDTLLDDLAMKKIKKYGFNYLNAMNLFDYSNSPLKLFFKALFLSLSSFSILNKNKIWKWLVIFENIVDVELKRNLYKIFNVKAVHQHEEWLSKTISKALAIKMEEGIFISNMWSITSFPALWFNYGISDITFTWGKYQVGFLKSHNYSSRYFIQTGLICGDNISPKRINYFNNITNQFNKKSKLIIGCFDNSFGSGFPNSYQSYINFYEKIIKIIFNNKNYALLIKPKKSNTKDFLIKHENTKVNLKKLFLDKRIIILDPDESISYASHFCDLTITYGIATAGFISKLIDTPNIFINHNGNRFHPIKYISGFNKFIIESLDDLPQAIDKIITNKLVISQKLKTIIDHYSDGLGNKRSGEFIGNYINALDRGKNREDSLNYALNSFKQKWGENSVSSEFSKNNEGLIIWEKSLSSIDSYFSELK